MDPVFLGASLGMTRDVKSWPRVGWVMTRAESRDGLGRERGGVLKGHHLRVPASVGSTLRAITRPLASLVWQLIPGEKSLGLVVGLSAVFAFS